MTEAPKRNVAASVRARLLNLSKQRREDFNLTLTRYALERFLYRLGQSRLRERYVLKGAALFALWFEALIGQLVILTCLARVDQIFVRLNVICATSAQRPATMAWYLTLKPCKPTQSGSTSPISAHV